MENIKRVYCLYRVSTVGQVEKDDIPMQKQFCREFVNCHSGWHIENEFYEKGISGYKVSAVTTKRPLLWNGLSATVLKSGVPWRGNNGLTTTLTSC